MKNLPSGRSFRVSTGANNFTKKLNQATRFGDLKNLRDNKDSILKALKPVERTIRLGKFGRLAQLAVMAKIRKLEGYKLTKQDKSDIKKVFAQLTGKNAAKVSEPAAIRKELDKDPDGVESSISSRRSNTISTKISGGRVKPINRDPNNDISYNGIRIQADKVPSRVIRTQLGLSGSEKMSSSEHGTSQKTTRESGLRQGSTGTPLAGKLY